MTAKSAAKSVANGGDINRREEILQRATELFSANGIDRTSMAEIAKNTGVAKPTLYHYFASKEELLYEIMEQLFAKAILVDDSAGDKPPLEQLRQVMRNLMQVVSEYKGTVKVFFEYSQTLPPERFAEMSERRRIYEKSTAKLLSGLMKDGTFRKLDVALTHRAIFGVCLWASQWYDSEGAKSPDEVADFFFDLLVEGLKKR